MPVEPLGPPQCPRCPPETLILPEWAVMHDAWHDAQSVADPGV